MARDDLETKILDVEYICGINPTPYKAIEG